MDNNKRRAIIKKQAAEQVKKCSEGVMPLTGEMVQIKLFVNRKLTDKGDRPPKKLNEVAATTVREKPTTIQVPPPRHNVGKGLMTAKGLVYE